MTREDVIRLLIPTVMHVIIEKQKFRRCLSELLFIRNMKTIYQNVLLLLIQISTATIHGDPDNASIYEMANNTYKIFSFLENPNFLLPKLWYEKKLFR